MSSDGYITTGEVVVETNYKKVYKLKDGRLIGFSGNGYNWKPILDYFNGHRKKWPQINGNTSILLLETNGRAYVYDSDGRSFERTVPVAIGSGWMFALGAMEAGASTEKAVWISARRDVCTGGSVFTETLL
jgi:ATP-dependent protease HslVU (ClpYQ) peptidase subunit